MFQTQYFELQSLLRVGEQDFCKLRDKSILVTGASGFIGNWLSRALIYANQEFNLNLKLHFLSRSINSSQLKKEFGGDRNLNFWEFDLAEHNFKSRMESEFQIIFHGATASKFNERGNNNGNAETGTVNLIAHITNGCFIPTFINLSSGAVYGTEARFNRIILESSRIPRKGEVSNTYVAEKIAIESLINEAGRENLIHGSNPRLFAFYGNGLPLDSQFAIGNFMRDIISKKSLQITGSPDSTRSYMHAAELVLALVKLSSNPIPGPVNIGGSDSVSVLGLANRLMSILEISIPIIIRNDESSPNHYVPGFDITQNSLIRNQFIDFSTGIKSWAKVLGL